MEQPGVERYRDSSGNWVDRKVGWTPPTKVNPGGLGGLAAKAKADRARKAKEAEESEMGKGKKKTASYRQKMRDTFEDA